jgi:hypothetical protein
MSGLLYNLSGNRIPWWKLILLKIVPGRHLVGIDWDDSNDREIVVVLGKKLFGVMYVVDEYTVPNNSRKAGC